MIRRHQLDSEDVSEAQDARPSSKDTRYPSSGVRLIFSGPKLFSLDNPERFFSDRQYKLSVMRKAYSQRKQRSLVINTDPVQRNPFSSQVLFQLFSCSSNMSRMSSFSEEIACNSKIRPFDESLLGSDLRRANCWNISIQRDVTLVGNE